MVLAEQENHECVGSSPLFRCVLDRVKMIAPRECTVMLLGESGTGKELIARYIHRCSSRAKGPFIPVDCTNLSGELFASQLFGHTKGAFTGAEQDALGFFCAADGGTLFLDEIGELPLNIQGKFLRALQESKIMPVGSVREIPVNVRVVCATNRNLEQMVAEGKFKKDLFYRLKVVEIDLPPLRDRREDILLLAEHFLWKQARKYHEPVKSLSPETIRILESYSWPGNVRELANAIEHACIFSRLHRLKPTDLPKTLQRTAPAFSGQETSEVVPLELMERNLVMNALRVAGGNQALAARMLQIERRRLYRMVQRYQLHALVG